MTKARGKTVDLDNGRVVKVRSNTTWVVVIERTEQSRAKKVQALRARYAWAEERIQEAEGATEAERAEFEALRALFADACEAAKAARTAWEQASATGSSRARDRASDAYQRARSRRDFAVGEPYLAHKLNLTEARRVVERWKPEADEVEASEVGLFSREVWSEHQSHQAAIREARRALKLTEARIMVWPVR